MWTKFVAQVSVEIFKERVWGMGQKMREAGQIFLSKKVLIDPPKVQIKFQVSRISISWDI